MDIRPAPSLDTSDAAALRRAFAGTRRADGGEGARVEIVDGRVVARRDSEEREVAREGSGDGFDRPTISDDGTRVAFVVKKPDGGQSFKVVTTSAQDWTSLTMTQDASASSPVEAVDIAPSGNELAFVTRSGELHVSPTLGGHGGRNHFSQLRDSLGEPLGGRDVELLPSGRVAVETAMGTYLLVDLGTPPRPLPMRDFDSEGWEARLREAEGHLGALTAPEREQILEEFGTAAVAAHAAPHGRVVLIQVRRSDDQVENLLLERRTGRRVAIGKGALEDPTWSSNGREVWLPHGPSATLSRVFNSWDADLGMEDLARRQAESPGIVQGEDAVWVGGVRVPRRAH